EGIVDAELFGNAKNYPNPGTPERAGLIGEADGSTLFLDEIGDLPERLQVHLLRALDADGEHQRLGESKTRRSSFRLVAATNRPLSSLKHDFLARFTHRVALTGLGERREDIPLVIRALLRRAAATTPSIGSRFFERRGGELAEPRIAPSLIIRLVRHSYDHHVRELDRLLWVAISSTREDFLDLTPEVLAELGEADDNDAPGAEARDPGSLTKGEIEAALASSANVSAAARALGLKNRFVLHRLIRKHGLVLEDGDE
ncbi:MAG: sigma 54-interacting transcriptional regulator, partial [Polyangiaceae bacterium]|nr:sigma 54-interacting transcriptional regulator [Polyangiaceae bacterium]